MFVETRRAVGFESLRFIVFTRAGTVYNLLCAPSVWFPAGVPFQPSLVTCGGALREPVGIQAELLGSMSDCWQRDKATCRASISNPVN